MDRREKKDKCKIGQGLALLAHKKIPINVESGSLPKIITEWAVSRVF